MYIQQSDLFWGLNQNFVSRVMGIARREAYGENAYLFRSDDPATDLYILAQGEVEITMDDQTQDVFTSNRVGEAFGWGSLIDRPVYGGNAICTTPVVVLKLERDRLLRLLDSDVHSGYLFYKHLAKALGRRLIRSYRQVAETSSM